jgi:hypothetical protein
MEKLARVVAVVRNLILVAQLLAMVVMVFQVAGALLREELQPVLLPMVVLV